MAETIRPNPAQTTSSGSLDLEQLIDILPALIDSLSDAVVVVDRARRVVAANRRYVEVFGVHRADVVGTACTEALHCPEVLGGPAPERCAACEALELARPERRIRTLPDAVGIPRKWEATFSPIVDGAGHATHVVEVWRDISDRSQLEVQLSHSERLASVGILAAGVAHEINNPLASIMAAAESLGRWLERNQFTPRDVYEARDTVQLMKREIERCRDTTGKLMLLGRPYATSPSWVDFNRAARDTLSLLSYELRKLGIETVESLDETLPPVWAREAGVRGVCMNLMINAVQAMPHGGRLRVTTARDGNRVRLEVEDTGLGIASQHLERIWDPFFTTKPVGQGTGLGLSITHRIVTRHGGTIRVESAPGQGARFIVELPVQGTGGDG
jgi:PAS domain S-box-containing protein